MIKIDPTKDKIKISSLSKNLVAHYPLDMESLQSATTFADKTPNENVGTKYGSVLKFDGGNDYVNCGNNASLELGTSDFSISGWLKSDYSGGAIQDLVSSRGSGAPGTRKGWGVRLTTSYYLGIELDDGNAGTSRAGNTVGSTALNDNKWHHYTVTFDRDGYAKGYVDGVYDGVQIDISSGGDATGASNPLIGKAPTNDFYFNGSIGDTRIYSRALTPAEVLTMYQGGVVSDTGLVAHYKMGDKEDAVLTDETGTNNGALTDFADTTAEYGNTHDSGWVTDDTPNVFALDRKGHSGKSLSFDGESDFVDCGNDASLNLTDAITISTWINPIAWIDALATSIITRRGGSTGYFLFRLSTTNIINIDFGAASQRWNTEYDAPLNTWTHLSYTFDSVNKGRFYVNGELNNTTELGVGVSSAAPLYLGRDNINDAYYFNGSLADVRIYKRALDPAEITMLFSSYRPKIIIN